MNSHCKAKRPYWEVQAQEAARDRLRYQTKLYLQEQTLVVEPEAQHSREPSQTHTEAYHMT